VEVGIITSREKRTVLIFILIYIFFIFILIESFSFFVTSLHDRKNFLCRVRFSRDEIERVMKSSTDYCFDPDLGWDSKTVFRCSKSALPASEGTEDVFCSAYGDSFTWCDEVNDEETWEEIFRSNHGLQIKNLGVCAYGTDQAFLKLRKYYQSNPSRVVILGVYPENICRVINTLRRFYTSTDTYPLVKPRFVLDAGGKNKLLSSPILKADDLLKLESVEMLKSLAVHDFWYERAKKLYGFDMIAGRTFPYSIEFGNLLRSRLKNGRNPEFVCPMHYYYARPDREPLRIMTNIMDDFAAFGKSSNFIPVVLIHTSTLHELYINEIEALSGHCERNGILCFNAYRLFHGLPDRGRSLFRPHGHYSAEGNLVIAEELYLFFKKHDLLPGQSERVSGKVTAEGDAPRGR